MTAGFVFTAFLIAACIVAGWLDVTTRRLPNWLCAITFLGGLAHTLVQPGWAELGSQIGHAAMALVAGMVLFRMNVLGGGDAKFFASVAVWFPLSQAVPLLTLVSLAGLVLLFVWFGYRRATSKPIMAAGGTGFDSLPYGIAIGAGAIALRLAPLVHA